MSDKDSRTAQKLLMSEFKELNKLNWTTIELARDNIFEWNVVLLVLHPESQYHGGYFKAKMTFPRDYPNSPPDFRFLRPIWHPNVYPDGRLCISILHPPGDDIMSGELATERWTSAQGAESVLMSILSLLDDAEPASPANVDAGIMLRKDPAKFKELVKRDIEQSRKDIPDDFTMPKYEDAFKTQQEEEYMMSWEDSDAEDDFDGSDSEMEDQQWDDEENEDVDETTLTEDEEEDGKDEVSRDKSVQ